MVPVIGTPFDSPTPKGQPPYHLRGPDPDNEARHRRLLAATEARVRGQAASPLVTNPCQPQPAVNSTDTAIGGSPGTNVRSDRPVP